MGEQEALQDRSWNRLFFRRLCVGQVPCRELWAHLTRPGQYRPAGKDTLAICLASFLYEGLAAASVPKPTVAQYTRCFRHLQVAKIAKESGPYGEAPRHEVMAMLDHFPEKGG